MRIPDDLRGWLLRASPTKIRLTLPDDIPGGDHTLRIGFEYEGGGEDGASPGTRGWVGDRRSSSGTIALTIERLVPGQHPG